MGTDADGFFGSTYGIVSNPLGIGLTFMLSLSGIAQPLIWALALSNTHDITSRITTICATFIGWSVGGLLGEIYWTAVTGGEMSYIMSYVLLNTPMSGYMAIISVVYGLQILILGAWYIYYLRENRALPYAEVRRPDPGVMSDWAERRGMLEIGGVPGRGDMFRFYP
ncbi:hypothetical protein B0J12DRAFT_648507 [Macrophomina phaseolina]|uniref:Major facilitator superfamily domain general substrate transporter n=1 Tax=Macrophomina phaseolina TaxID=35725 RepID=A0ABQ8GRY4_9PEZI|nr:hypothetical protein B0J12DRAFT_648507 [Macrophomina phaseolina]